MKLASPPDKYVLYPAVSDFYLRFIIEQIALAWQLIMSKSVNYDPPSYGPGDFDDEKKITASLKYVLKTKTELQRYVSICEDHVYSCNDVEKEPDLTLAPIQMQYQSNLLNALFIECKLIKQGDSLSNYILHGLLRFVEGEYAWRMPHGMLLAYNENPQSCPIRLETYFRNASKMAQTCNPLDGCHHSCFSQKGFPVVYKTNHNRKCTGGIELPDIEVTHYWLSVVKE